MNLMQIAFVFFAAVAAGGVLMAAMIAAKRRIPAILGPGHGLGGCCALSLLVIALLRSPSAGGRAWLACGVLAAGLIGGVLFFAVLFRKRAPLPLVLEHGSLGAIGIFLLYRIAFPA